MTEPETYQSPFSWRYASPEMRALWSEQEKRRLWRRVWLALAEAQLDYGLVSAGQLAELRAHAKEINLPRALQIETEIRHDLMAELKTFAEQCPLGGGILHLGATSMDIEDNADALRLRAGLDVLLERLRAVLRALGERAEQWADLPVMAFTHLQPAEPTTLGYRLAFYAQDLLADFHALRALRGEIRGKGFKGAVGTAAAYCDLIGVENFPAFESRLSDLLDLPFFAVATQVAPRRQEYTLLSALAGLGASLSKFAFDLRLLQSPPLGELSEPFGARQVGSSAMPFKRNPIQSEKINSLARTLAAMPLTAWHNAAHSLLERTLDDSANRRTLLPEAFLTVDELLLTALKILQGLRLDEYAVQRNLAAYAPFAATERVMMALARKGADRQETHERLREHALAAWAEVQRGAENPLLARLLADPAFTALLSVEELRALFDVGDYT
ncbi:MAG TPA: adenylosuccinate lyase, partial [Anaerolineaceae bacterium]|nr:adenylosuccinate lyase [Anaerolineaceae bacterium]